MFQYFKFLADLIHVHILFSVAVGWPLEPPRLIVDRIRRDGRAPPVPSLPGIAPHCSQFRFRSLRFESCLRLISRTLNSFNLLLGVKNSEFVPRKK